MGLLCGALPELLDGGVAASEWEGETPPCQSCPWVLEHLAVGTYQAETPLGDSLGAGTQQFCSSVWSCHLEEMPSPGQPLPNPGGCGSSAVP